MLTQPLQLVSYPIILIIILSSFPSHKNNNLSIIQTSYAKHHKNPPPPLCNSSSCGEIRNISYPFRLQNDPPHCGNSNYELTCEKNNNITSIYINSQKFLVLAINYDTFTIRIRDAYLIRNDTCSFPLYPFSLYNFTKFPPQGLKKYKDPTALTYTGKNTTPIISMSCPYPIKDSSAFVETTDCFSDGNVSHTIRHYMKIGSLNASYLGEMCTIGRMMLTSWRFKNTDSGGVSNMSEIHEALLYGLELSWFSVYCDCRKHDFCYVGDDNRVKCNKEVCYLGTIIIGTAKCYGRMRWFFIALGYIMSMVELILPVFIRFHIGIRILIGMPCALIFLLYKYKRRHLSMFDGIEGFLRSQNNLIPIRYSYSDINKMTKKFREKLGNGGYGSVYKGKLRSGRDVAVKLLDNPLANGQDFINEVATIGRIHHVNVVRLVGYCVERSKRALVYDFMPNGSLEKYIFNQEGAHDSLMTWEKKYEIAIGVARGIEYLHRGCDIQILHFDIKPHNILLDENFTPKISDFGLAKFYSTDNSIVTLTAARGTIGYVAPELINRSIGGVSYKVDIYSFGMLLMEMVGLNRNVIANTDQSSQYFPHWIYDRFNKGKDIEIGNVGDEDDRTREITRKITIVALWCIQMSPEDRPSMSKVLEMLELGEDELLHVPPQPSHSHQMMVQNYDLTSETNDSDDSMALLYDCASNDQ